MSQTIKLNDWDYPVEFEDKQGYGTVAVIGNEPIVLTYQFSGGRWVPHYSDRPPLSTEDSAALCTLFEERPKPSLEERVEALEKQAFRGASYPAYQSDWRSKLR